MALDLLFKFSVTKKLAFTDAEKAFTSFLEDDEKIKLAYTHKRDKVVFTNKKLIALDVQGITGSKKEYRVFPYSKITSFSVETSGSLDSDGDFKIWVSGVGIFEIKFSSSINIKEIGMFLSKKIL